MVKLLHDYNGDAFKCENAISEPNIVLQNLGYSIHLREILHELISHVMVKWDVFLEYLSVFYRIPEFITKASTVCRLSD